MSNVAQSPAEAQAESTTPSPSSDTIAYLCNAIQHIVELVDETQAATLSVRGNMADVSDATRAAVETQFAHLHQQAIMNLQAMKALLCQEIDNISTTV